MSDKTFNNLRFIAGIIGTGVTFIASIMSPIAEMYGITWAPIVPIVSSAATVALSSVVELARRIYNKKED